VLLGQLKKEPTNWGGGLHTDGGNVASVTKNEKIEEKCGGVRSPGMSTKHGEEKFGIFSGIGSKVIWGGKNAT